MTVHKYVIYGLGIHSQIPLWGDRVAECAADIRVRWEIDQQTGRASGSAHPAAAGADEIVLAWPDVCEMSVRGGREIVVRTGPHPEPTYLRHLVSGIGLGLALHQRGVFTLHAGAVEIEATAVVIMGHKGAGKSTLTAALRARGHSLLSDDVVALELPVGDRPRVLVGAPNLNLWPDAARATGHDMSDFSPICARSPKLAGWIPGGQRKVPTELGAIVVLSNEASAPGMQKLGPVDAFTRLISHSHAFRWIPDAPDRRQHFAQCHQVLQRVPVLSLHRGESLDSLPALVDLVESLVVRRSCTAIEPLTLVYS